MKKSVRNVFAMIAAPAAILSASPAQAQDIFGQIGDHFENVWKDSLRDARNNARRMNQIRQRERERAYQEEVRRQRDEQAYQRSLRDRQVIQQTAPPNSDCTQSSSASSNGRNVRNNVRQNCTQRFSTGPNGQQVYTDTPSGDYPRTHGDSYYRNNNTPRQVISEDAWVQMIDRCADDLRREYPRSTTVQRYNACTQGMSTQYTVRYRR